jgi:hypothetical protein
MGDLSGCELDPDPRAYALAEALRSRLQAATADHGLLPDVDRLRAI